MTTPYKKKLIEVAIPLDAINAASVREKSIRHGHPSTLHLWWARRPLATCRAVLFAQLVDDPSAHPELFPDDEAVEAERKRLFQIIEDLVKWENSTNEGVLERARAEISKSCDGDLPSVYDPFSGGSSIPLEAQRLGLRAYGSDLNPVAVTIGKAMIEIPVKFKDRKPAHPGVNDRSIYRNAQGLAEDVKYYGQWMRDKAYERIGHLYPDVDMPKGLGGGKATVIAWIWARTAPSPDPAFGSIQVPLVSSFVLSKKVGKDVCWIEPIIDRSARSIEYRIRIGGTKDELATAAMGTTAGKKQAFRCIMSNAAISYSHIRSAGKAGKMGRSLIAIVAEGKGSKVFVAPSPNHENIAWSAKPEWILGVRLPENPRDFKTPNYGLVTFGDLFTDRQLVALSTFNDLVHEARTQIESDALSGDFPNDLKKLKDDGTGAKAYAEAVGVYLAFIVSKCSDYNSTICSWIPQRETVGHTFVRHAIPMIWDFVEANIFSGKAGSFSSMSTWIEKALLGFTPAADGQVQQMDAQSLSMRPNGVIACDPPYYDNIGYADLSDFFYYWMRPALKETYPNLFSVFATPKADELVATRYRDNRGKKIAEESFMHGMKFAIGRMVRESSDLYPATIYYAFKQREVKKEGVSSTGWATFLESVIDAGYAVVGTWPVRTERSGRMIAIGTNALANSVVLVCRKKGELPDTVTRAEFIRALRDKLPTAIAELQSASISPADMPQSAIGPGIGVFSGYSAVLEANDKPMTVKTALELINRELDEFLNEIQGEFDANTRFSITWFEQNGYGTGSFGVANNIAQARGISVESVKLAGIVESSAGKVRILRREELRNDSEPDVDNHLTIWECLQYLVRKHERNGISEDTAVFFKKIGGQAETVKELAYCLYAICADKRGDAGEATVYNALIADWAELAGAATVDYKNPGDAQSQLGL